MMMMFIQTKTTENGERRTKKGNREWRDNRKRRATAGGGSKIRSQVKRLKHVGAQRGTARKIPRETMAFTQNNRDDDDNDVQYYIGERLKLEGETTENRSVCTKE